MRKDIEILTQKLVKIRTTQGKTKDAVAIIADYLEKNGIKSDLNEYKEGCVNLDARIGPKDANAIVISGHLDVVPEGNIDNWEHDPYSGEIIDGELWGRGSVDMKGGCATLAGVMVELKKIENKLTHEIRLAITAEEEIGLLGAWEFIKGDIMENATHLLIAEPTGLDVAIMEKGIIWAKFSIVGKQAHGSRPDLGKNAIEALANLIPDLYKILPETSLPEVGQSTMNVGTINGGSAPNVVPETAEMICDFRLTPGVELSDIENKINELVKNKSEDGIHISVEYLNNAPSVISHDRSLGNIIANKLEKSTGNKPKLSGMYFATDGAAFMSKKVVSFAIFGPGSKEYLHQTNERLDLEQLDLSRKIIIDTILEINQIIK